MNIKKRGSTLGAERLTGRVQAVWTSVAVLAVAASAAFGQVQNPGSDSGPLEDTWQYLIELFRMMLGL